jgi:hypothetical protein
MAAKPKASAAKRTKAVNAAPSHIETAEADAATLELIRDQLRVARDTELRIADLTSVLQTDSKTLQQIKFEVLPEIFANAGVDQLGLAAEGNKPAYDAKLSPYFRANIAANWDEERRAKAFKELEKRGAQDLIKTEITILVSRDDRAKVKAIEAALKKLKCEYEIHAAVPHTTLTAWVKEQIVEHKKAIPLDTFGATVGMVVNMKERKTNG